MIQENQWIIKRYRKKLIVVKLLKIAYVKMVGLVIPLKKKLLNYLLMNIPF